MYHSLKRATVGSLAVRNEPSNAEYDGLRRVLEDVNRKLHHNLTHFETVQRKWKHLLDEKEKLYFNFTQLQQHQQQNQQQPQQQNHQQHSNQRQHSNQPSSVPPTPLSPAAQMYRKAADICNVDLRNAVHTIVKPGSNHTLLLLAIQTYLTELKVIFEECNRVDKARKDYIMYVQKVDKLKKATNELHYMSERYDRNLDKLEKYKVLYDALLNAALKKMYMSYKKSDYMFQSLFIIYNQYSVGMCHLISFHFNPVYQFCKQNESSVMKNMISFDPNTISDFKNAADNGQPHHHNGGSSSSSSSKKRKASGSDNRDHFVDSIDPGPDVSMMHASSSSTNVTGMASPTLHYQQQQFQHQQHSQLPSYASSSPTSDIASPSNVNVGSMNLGAGSASGDNRGSKSPRYGQEQRPWQQN